MSIKKHSAFGRVKIKKMKIILGITGGLFVVIIIGLVVYFNIQNYTFNPKKAEFVYSDMENFTSVFNKLGSSKDSLQIINALYLDKKTKGFSSYISNYRLTDKYFLSQIRRSPELYKRISIEGEKKLRAVENEIKHSFKRFKKLYPRAIFPPTYYFVAQNIAGGANNQNGVLIATEVYGSKKNDTLINHTLEDVKHLVAHELVHFNQFTGAPIAYFSNNDNLSRAIKEGAADFIANLISGNHINQKAHKYGLINEVKLWEEFKKIMKSNTTGEWFFKKPKLHPEWPQDLGYFIGYRIIESFYKTQTDKKKAIKKIIRIRNYDKFLVKSDYSPK